MTVSLADAYHDRDSIPEDVVLRVQIFGKCFFALQRCNAVCGASPRELLGSHPRKPGRLTLMTVQVVNDLPTRALERLFGLEALERALDRDENLLVELRHMLVYLAHRLAHLGAKVVEA